MPDLTAPSASYPQKSPHSTVLVIVLIAGLLIGAIAGMFYGSKTLGSMKRSGQATNSTLANAVFSQIYSNVAGTITAVDASSITIRNGEDTLKIQLQKDTTKFYGVKAESSQSAELSLDKVQVGKYLVGTVDINKDALLGKGANLATGVGFTVYDQAPPSPVAAQSLQPAAASQSAQ